MCSLLLGWEEERRGVHMHCEHTGIIIMSIIKPMVYASTYVEIAEENTTYFII